MTASFATLTLSVSAGTAAGYAARAQLAARGSAGPRLPTWRRRGTARRAVCRKLVVAAVGVVAATLHHPTNIGGIHFKALSR